MITTKQFTLLLVAGAALAATGCERRIYGPPPPPPPYAAVPPLVGQAQQFGFRAGLDDGARDAINGYGYHPHRDRNFRVTPGYDPRLGPLGAYRRYFRASYERGYSQAFNRQAGPR